MTSSQYIEIPAFFMRGGTSNGVFLRLDDLPPAAQEAGIARDRLLMRLIGSPDPYGKQIDGMGGGSSSTSKAVIISKSTQTNHDVDYLFGQVAIDKPFVDWSGNCGNLSAAVGSFAIESGLIAVKIDNGVQEVKIWQANIGKTIIAQVPIENGKVKEVGDFVLDGVTFPAAEVKLSFVSPSDGVLFPTGNTIDKIVVPEIGSLKATLISAGIPTVFVNAADIGFSGCELQDDINSNPNYLKLLENIRAAGALKMGLIQDLSEIANRQHTPKVAFVAPPADYTASSGKQVLSNEINLLVRAVSMGKLHHAMMGTAAVAISAAAAVPNTLVSNAAGGAIETVCFGHPSGTLTVGASVAMENGQWVAKSVTMSRSSRVLMRGWVRVPCV
ncbi:MAG: 2-methylaconitate cis-trans isomerase PrpF [Neisseriaceae bacterium]|nr:2-methylaconitate cis-trans isomerase PrpF [Neisseriaceae bacterium]